MDQNINALPGGNLVKHKPTSYLEKYSWKTKRLAIVCIKASPRLFCSRACRSLCNIKFVFVKALLQYYIVLPGHYLFNGPFLEGTVLEFMTERGGIATEGGKEFANISSPSVSDFGEIFIPLKVEEPPVVPFYLLKVNYQGHPNGSVERLTQEQEHSCSPWPAGLPIDVRG